MGGAGREQPTVAAQSEAVLVELGAGLGPPRSGGRGRPPILPAAMLWASLTIGVLRGVLSQAAVWRLVMDRELWRGAGVRVSDEAVYKRLAQASPSPLGTLFADLTTFLQSRLPAADRDLAPFATDVVVIDETTLDQVARTLPTLRDVPAGDRRLFPGKIAAVFDVRRQLFRTIQLIANPVQNEKVAAREVLATVPPGALVLADLGYFGFAWFDDLTEQGYHWLSRLRAKTSYRVEHVYYENDLIFDGLVWLGAHRADRAKHLVRLVSVSRGATTHAYLTNVTDPRQLAPRQLTALYAQRWDIELAVKLVKRHLGLHLLWSAKPAVIAHQIWAVLLLAQIFQALRMEIAQRAAVAVDEVSMALMIQHLPRYAAASTDPIAAFIADGRLLGYIRPSRRIVPTAPLIPPRALNLPPPTLIRTQHPRYGEQHRQARRPLTIN